MVIISVKPRTRFRVGVRFTVSAKARAMVMDRFT
jgi:hypothetical protein